MKLPRGAAAALIVAMGTSCGKVPIHDVAAGFALADVAWFAEEETLFVFYEVNAEQGLGEPSVIEISYGTDDERVDWTPLAELPMVHSHVAVDCGSTSLCGSASLHVPIEPRGVDLRLRYHRDGELSLDARTVYNVVGPGAAHSHRSMVVYGVFDESNEWVQWRGRHQFPTLRNEEAEYYGLRREFVVRDQRYGSQDIATAGNPYGYGGDCPASFAALEIEEVGTDQRAISNPVTLPLDASDASTVCGDSTVHDATGSFTAAAIARKNPEVRPAFPILSSPVHDTTPIPFFLAPCLHTISEEHEAMQRQRLHMEDLPATCIDGWEQEGFVNELVVLFTDAIEAERAAGEDMVLVIGLHQDDQGVSEAVEEALAAIVPEERRTSSPRLAGAFVFDSDIRGISLPELDPVTLWCPSKVPDEDDTGLSYSASLTCAIAPDNPDIELGPFSFGSLPILPSRELYLDFIDTYSEAQAGRVDELVFRAPEFSTTADHIDLGEYGAVTFLDDEFISTVATDALSYCAPEEYQLIVFRSQILQNPQFLELIAQECESGGVDAELCAWAQVGVVPIDWLSQWHGWFGETTYELGVFWEFPFLLRMEYEAFAAGAVSAFGLSVPFGLGTTGEAYAGSYMWTVEEFDLEEALTQCTRFCDHPTFDASGVYQVADDFRSTYVTSCYLPSYPLPGASGFPLDP